MPCSVCAHECRAEIETAILSIGPDNTEVTLATIAEQYDISEQDLRIHALMHNPLGSSVEKGEERDSLVRRLKLKEADMLSAAANEYMVTLKNVGRKINSIAANQDPATLSRLLSKSMTDLYLGLGGEIRNTVKTLAELDTELNGSAANGVNGLVSLVKALRASDD